MSHRNAINIIALASIHLDVRLTAAVAQCIVKQRKLKMLGKELQVETYR